MQHQKIISNLTMKHKLQVYREKLNQLRYSHRRDSNIQSSKHSNPDKLREKHNMTELSECTKSQKGSIKKNRKEYSSNIELKSAKKESNKILRDQLKILSVCRKRDKSYFNKKVNSQITENDQE